MKTGIGNLGFVRGFGPARRRLRGADYAWLDEQSYCSAARAVRLKGLPYADADRTDRVRCAFRRLFYDGLTVARVEIGLSYSWMTEKDRYVAWDDMPPDDRDQTTVDAPFAVLDSVLRTPAIVPAGSPEGAAKERPLILQGRNLAQFYAEATTKHVPNAAAAAERDLVVAGNPLVILECGSGQIESLGQGFHRVDPAKIGGVDLAFGMRHTALGDLGIWLAGYSNTDFATLRSFRLCLARLHAELEVLQSALSKLKAGSITYKPGEPHSELLESYVNSATRWINKKSWAGIEKSSILAAFTAAEDSPKGQAISLLRQRLSGAHEQVIRKAERFEKMNRKTVNLIVENLEMKSITIGDNATINAPVTVADTIQGSFNTIQAAQVDEEVKATIEDLLKEIAAASKEMDPEEGQELAREADDLVNEIDSEKPRQRKYKSSIETIKEYAQKIGEVGEPILKTCGKLLPLLLALFP